MAALAGAATWQHDSMLPRLQFSNKVQFQIAIRCEMKAFRNIAMRDDLLGLSSVKNRILCWILGLEPIRRCLFSIFSRKDFCELSYERASMLAPLRVHTARARTRIVVVVCPRASARTHSHSARTHSHSSRNARTHIAIDNGLFGPPHRARQVF